MSNLVIIGASALGREVCTYAKVCGLSVKGFLDSRDGVLDGKLGYPPILGSAEDYSISSEDVFVCAVGETLERRKYVECVKARGGAFLSIVHPTAVIGANVQMGEGCIVRPYAVIGNDAVVGDHVIIGTQSLVAHDCCVGEYVTISPGCHIAGWVKLKNGVFMGIHSAIIPHVVLGESVVVAAGAVVVGNVVSGRVMGVPAKVK